MCTNGPLFVRCHVHRICAQPTRCKSPPSIPPRPVLGALPSFHFLKLPPLDPDSPGGHELLNGARHCANGYVKLHQQQALISLGNGLGLQLYLALDPALEVQRDIALTVRVYRHLGICAQGSEVGEWVKEAWHAGKIRRAEEKERAAQGGPYSDTAADVHYPFRCGPEDEPQGLKPRRGGHRLFYLTIFEQCEKFFSRHSGCSDKPRGYFRRNGIVDRNNNRPQNTIFFINSMA